MKLYLMRHGETLFNTQKRVQGWCDSPLTENGIWQAEQAKQYFAKKGISFDAVYSSTQVSTPLRKRERLIRPRLWRLTTR